MRDFLARNEAARPAALARLQKAAAEGGNVFAELVETVKVASLGSISHALYEVGGRYRRSVSGAMWPPLADVCRDAVPGFHARRDAWETPP